MAITPESVDAQQPSRCRVINLMPMMRAFWAAERGQPRADQQIAFLREFVDQYPDLYSQKTLRDGVTVDDAVDHFLDNLPADMPAIHAMSVQIQKFFPAYLGRFRNTFPKYACDPDIYLYPALYAFDGGLRVVDRRPALLFGVDTISEIYDASRVQMLFDHELFHQYNAQETGIQGAAAGNPLYLPLWSEG